jgi:hypothetical protein
MYEARLEARACQANRVAAGKIDVQIAFPGATSFVLTPENPRADERCWRQCVGCLESSISEQAARVAPSKDLAVDGDSPNLFSNGRFEEYGAAGLILNR